jgi:hypothetical protein
VVWEEKEEWTSGTCALGKSSQRSEAAMLRFDWPRWLQACHFTGKVAGDRLTASSLDLCPFGRNHPCRSCLDEDMFLLQETRNKGP